MTRTDIPTADELWGAACHHFPVLSQEEQRAGIVLLRELTKGEPVAIAQLAHHQITLYGRKLWAWCAPDTLEYPELLGETVDVETRDPETDQLTRLTVSPAGIEAVEPAGVVVSMRRPEAWDATSAARIIASACHFNFFFASRESGERWVAKHPETLLLSLDEVFAFIKRCNRHMFGAELARREADAV